MQTTANSYSIGDIENIMKRSLITFLIALSFSLLRNASGQGFVNLNFESAVIVQDPSSPYYPYAYYASNAIPGWTPDSFLGPNDVKYNEPTAGAASVSIVDNNGYPRTLGGEYSVLLYGGAGIVGASISQTGTVPSNSLSILFRAQYYGPPGGILLVSLGGQNIPFFSLSSGTNYTLYGGDISAFAGQSEQLTFTASPENNNYWSLDNIQFSSSPVPEPGSLRLFSVFVLLLCWRKKRPKQRIDCKN